MKEEEKKQAWETPGIVDLDVESTDGGAVHYSYEDAAYS